MDADADLLPPLPEEQSWVPRQWVVELAKQAVLSGSVWDRYLATVQTVCAVAGLVGAGVTVRRQVLYPYARPVEVLFNRLRAEGGPLTWPVVRFDARPYEGILSPGSKAVILQGRVQEGKTTLLRTSIPWCYSWRIWGFRGLYLNGREALTAATFHDWITRQMFGSRTAATQEVKRALTQFRKSQWVRLLLEACWFPIRPRPVFVIVDQFEELLRSFPHEALCWADQLTYLHTRDKIARVIFVVNTDAGARSLMNLSWQGARFRRVILEPKKAHEMSRLKLIDPDVFELCGRNIGLYKLVRSDILRGDMGMDEARRWVDSTTRRWRRERTVPFPLRYDPSWNTLDLRAVKRELLAGLATVLRSPAEEPRGDALEVHRLVAQAHAAVKRMDLVQIFETPQSGWVSILINERSAREGLSRADALVLAKSIYRVLGQPVGEAQPFL